MVPLILGSPQRGKDDNDDIGTCYGGFPKIRGAFLGAPMIRSIAYRGQY